MEFEKTATCLAIEIGCGDRNDRIEAIEMALRAAATVPSGMVRVGTEDMTMDYDSGFDGPYRTIIVRDQTRAKPVSLSEIHSLGLKPPGGVDSADYVQSLRCPESPAAAQAARERGGEGC